MLSFSLKKLLHQLCALCLKYTTGHLRLRMQRFGRKPSEATFLVTRSIDEPSQLAPPHRTSTHHTWLHRHVERTPRQVLSPQCLRRSRNRLHLCMSRHIVQRLRQVMPPADDPSLSHHHSPHRNLSLLPSCLRLLQRHPHILFVCRHTTIFHHAFGVTPLA